MAQKTYYGTLFHRDLTEAKILLVFTDKTKYEKDAEETEVSVTGVKSWTVVEGGKEAEGCERWLNEKDENDEYLVLTYADGRFDVYRNSHVAMFIF